MEQPAADIANSAEQTGQAKDSTVNSGVVKSAAPAKKSLSPSELVNRIETLKTEQKSSKDERARVARDLKNARRRKTRLANAARNLSDGDLVALLQHRGAERKEKERVEERPRSRSPTSAPETQI